MDHPAALYITRRLQSLEFQMYGNYMERTVSYLELGPLQGFIVQYLHSKCPLSDVLVYIFHAVYTAYSLATLVVDILSHYCGGHASRYAIHSCHDHTYTLLQFLSTVCSCVVCLKHVFCAP